MNNLEEETIALPLTQLAYQTANQFADEQVNLDKAERIRLNTLAVWVVHDYLNLMGIATDITKGDSWNPIMRMSADVADLEITGVGFLECIPCQTPANSYPVAPEVWSDRIGYLVVQIDDSLREGTILGFSPEVQNGVISQLQSWDSFLTHLDSLMSRVTVEETLVNLSQWFEEIFTTGWETVAQLLSTSETNLAFSFRGAETESDNVVRRGKVFDLGETFDKVILLLELTTLESGEKIITLKLYPADTNYLAENLQLLILDDSDTILTTTVSSNSDNYLQLRINGITGERFTVQIVAENNTVRENFVI